ncbi:glycosyltransferase [Enterococcus faecalis]|uniref:glycosyltransferase n=1 Tax=Enterococcus faecalis TaxID=1351 RepID=UPI000FFF42CA|nr:glycosyltransferase [Enterococcus faecalis]MDT2152592.1 glycosyltransferase [Enterococcus faecalis]MEB7954614.1 glycosyltransferase [Enterococcus faecalis]MEB7964750.1 glycosyltransferase [Enterococcus faecalis]RXF25734.1 glycosyltransferase [Enterococcus faecalis]
MKLNLDLILSYPDVYKNILEKDYTITKFPNISVCIMVKNESRCIKRCIESIYQLSDEIIIVDTGSTDNTIEIVSSYSKTRIFKKYWNDDFSEIRNFMIKNAKNEWIFQIDADEYINEKDISNYKEIISILDVANITPKVVSPKILDYDNNETYSTFRIFKKEPKLKYHGLIHEELRYNNTTIFPTISIDLAINHDGYRPKIICDKDKYSRNYRLLKKMIQIEPRNIRWYFFLVREALLFNEKSKIIEKYIEQALDITSENNEYKAGILIKYIELKLDSDPNFALDIINKYINIFPNCIDFIYYKLLLASRNAFEIVSSENKNSINELREIDNQYSFIDSNGSHIFEVLGWNYFLLGDLEIAQFFFKQIKNPNIQKSVNGKQEFIKKFLEGE